MVIYGTAISVRYCDAHYPFKMNEREILMQVSRYGFFTAFPGHA